MDATYARSIVNYIEEYARMLHEDINFKKHTEYTSSNIWWIYAFLLAAYCRTHGLTENQALPASSYFYSRARSVDMDFLDRTNNARNFALMFTVFMSSYNMCDDSCEFITSDKPLMYNVFCFYYNQIANDIPPNVTYSVIQQSYAQAHRQTNPNMGYAPPVYAPPIYQQPAYTPPAYAPPVYAPPVYQQSAYGYRSIHNPYFGVSGGGKFGFYVCVVIVLFLINIAVSIIEVIAALVPLLPYLVSATMVLFYTAVFRQSFKVLFFTQDDRRTPPYNNTGGFLASLFLVIGFIRGALNIYSALAYWGIPVNNLFYLALLFCAALAGFIFYETICQAADKILIYPAYAICESFLK